MKQGKILLILIILALASTAFLSTLARFTDEYTGSDVALVAKWNFGARGEEDIEGVFYNKGFTFDLFNAKTVEPMDYGVKSFTFTGGGSDVGIVYDVEMNARDLFEAPNGADFSGLARGTVAKTPDVDVYAPFIFKITVAMNEGATDDPPVVFSPPGVVDDDDVWFRPGDIETDDDGFFSIFKHIDGDPFFSTGSTDQVTVTVYWQWNTSCFINDTGIAAVVEPEQPVVPDTSTEITGDYLPYYQAAYDLYYGEGGLDEQRKAAARAVEDYLIEHGSPSSDGAWTHYVYCVLTGGEHEQIYNSLGPEEQGGYLALHGGSIDEETGIIWAPHSFLCPEDHFAQYNHLIGLEQDAIEACETSLMAAYDDYDTLAADALVAKESVKVIFRIRGDQMAPGQKSPPAGAAPAGEQMAPGQDSPPAGPVPGSVPAGGQAPPE